MAWTDLPVNYTDAIFEGNRKYTMINNPDGTVSFVDVTEYTNNEHSEFGASDANAMNKAINDIMSGGELMSKTMYDPGGVVEAAGGIPKYVIPTTQKAAANGVAPLDGSKKVPAANLPTSDAVNSNVSTTVATSKAVKTAYDKAVAGPNAAAVTISSKSSNTDKATLSGEYFQIGKMVVCHLKLVFSGSLSAGAIQEFGVTLPGAVSEFKAYIGPLYVSGEVAYHYTATVKTTGRITFDPVVASGLGSAAADSVIDFTLCYATS